MRAGRPPFLISAGETPELPEGLSLPLRLSDYTPSDVKFQYSESEHSAQKMRQGPIHQQQESPLSILLPQGNKAVP